MSPTNVPSAKVRARFHHTARRLCQFLLAISMAMPVHIHGCDGCVAPRSSRQFCHFSQPSVVFDIILFIQTSVSVVLTLLAD
ncbi:hypothetical protein V1508DRAFT_418174 [Lipomyces doorenjongii]|uniref:uncharacterized protein n=1 Tax=Lipomyces doorenjongii TaxID=383834 RepID=UPI0034CD594A